MAVALISGAPSAPAAGLAGPPVTAGAASSRDPVKLSDHLLSNLAVGKVYRDHRGTVSGLDFTYDGQYLVTSGEDNNVYVYNTEKAQRTKHLRCEKYGASIIRFLHNDKDCVISASRSKNDHLLKYWDLHDNKYLRLFRSHTGKVLSASPHPYEDLFLSGSEDKTVMMWDLRAEKPVAKINGHGPAVATFDQQGLVFGACVGQQKLHLFDTRNYAKGEFTAFELAPHLKNKDSTVRTLQFSPCGKYLLVRTAEQLMLVDAFDGELICEYPVGGPENEAQKQNEGRSGAPPPVPGFSPDSQYVISGVQGGDVCIWGATNARLVHRLEGHTTTPSYACFSPTHGLAVTAAETLAWWIPDTRSASAAGA